MKRRIPAEDLRNLSADQRRALLTELLQKEAQKPKTFPLSYAQQRLWFLSQLDPQSAAYNMPTAIRLTGNLDIPALEKSVNEIIRRHEILRTTFVMRQGEGFQCVAPEFGLSLPVIPVEDLPGETTKSKLDRAVHEETHRPFNLEQGPLLRVKLLRLSHDEHLAMFVFHHIVSDGWSRGIFLRELVAFYSGFSRGAEPRLPELSIQYADFAVWQREWLKGEAEEKQLSYWQTNLENVPPLDLPHDFQRQKTRRTDGAGQSFKLSPGLVEPLKDLSRQEGCTLFMSLLAVFNTLLYRWSGKQDFAVGTAMTGRSRREVEDLIGFFVNTLALRADLSGHPTFRELLHRVRETVLDGSANQDVPFDKVVDRVKTRGHSSESPIFRTFFVLQNILFPSVTVSGLRIAVYPFQFTQAKFDLLMGIHEEPDVLTVDIEYRTALFRPHTIARLFGHFENLVRGIVRNPDARIDELPLLSAEEQQRVLVDFNKAAAVAPPDRCVQEIFEYHVRAHPDGIAMIAGDERVTYGKLNHRVNQLAHYLVSRGVKPETRVGVFLERSIDMVTSFLAVLKAGGVYVPLESAYPAKRLAFMMDDARVSTFLTVSELAERLPPGAKIIALDAERSSIDSSSGSDLPCALTPENLAYVMYTSGSTGEPKGIAVPHRAIVRLVQNTNYMRFGRDEVFLQLSPIAFDASTLEIWGALLNGAVLVMAPPGLVSLDEIAQLVAKNKVTTMWLTAGLFHQMVDLHLEGFRGVRNLLAGGDVLSVGRVQKAVQSHEQLVLINGYGPTENTTFTCCHRMAKADFIAGESIPIGRPISNTYVYVLDPALNPVPPGICGELYTGGAGLARGYFDRPDLTAEKFLPDPFHGPGMRMYRTGDLARWLPDATLEFAGRVDHQVKIRGFRVEPGEIEAVLSQHLGVQDAVVVTREAADGSKNLVAFVVGRSNNTLRGDELKKYLRENAPEYMVPADIVLIDALPLTANGKIDREALLAANPTSPQSANPYVAPSTELEKALAKLFSDALGGVPVGLYDNFFELGGHSLTATRLVSQVRSVLGIELPLRAFFEEPTVANVALAVMSAKGSRDLGSSIEVIPRDGRLSLSFAQQRLWFVDHLVPGSALYNIPLAIRLRGDLDTPVLERSLNEVVRRHEVLRTTFPTVEGRPVQVIAPVLKVTASIVDLSYSPDRENEVIRLAREEAQKPFDLARGPLLRAALLRLDEKQHVALITMHHIVSDGWSMGVLIREVAKLYESFVNDQPPQLPELPVQYADYAHWQRQRLHGEVFTKQLSFWRSKLEKLPVMELPVDRKRPSAQRFMGGKHPFELPESLTRSIHEQSQERRVTPFMMLLATFKVLLARYSGQEDIVVGSPIAGRNRSEIDGLIGFFVNMLVLRTDLGGNPTFLEVLRRVRETSLDAYANQDLPCDKLVEELQPDRDLSRPLVQVAFALQNLPIDFLEIPGLALELVEAPTGQAKCDLSVVMWEIDQRLSGVFEYDSDLFDHATIVRMAGHFQTLLEAIVVSPERRILELPLLDSTEKSQLLTIGKRIQDTQLDAALEEGVL
jgi:amino acid adenylation domain-containing protein